MHVLETHILAVFMQRSPGQNATFFALSMKSVPNIVGWWSLGVTSSLMASRWQFSLCTLRINDLNLGTTTSMAPTMVSFDLVFYSLSEKVTIGWLSTMRTSTGFLVADKLSFLSLEIRSGEIAQVTADAANRLFMCNRPCTDRKYHAALK